MKREKGITEVMSRRNRGDASNRGTGGGYPMATPPIYIKTLPHSPERPY